MDFFARILWVSGKNIMMLEEVSWATWEDPEKATETKMVLAFSSSPTVSFPFYHPILLLFPFLAENSACPSKLHARFLEAHSHRLRSPVDSPGNDFSGRWGWMWWPLQTITASKTACCSLPLLWVETSHCPEDAKSGCFFTLTTVVLNKHREGLINYSGRALKVRMGWV